jgi:hypothetical protein
LIMTTAGHFSIPCMGLKELVDQWRDQSRPEEGRAQIGVDRRPPIEMTSQVGGDCISLVAQVLSLSMPDAAERLQDMALLNAEIETGMFKKPVEVLARQIHYELLPADVRAAVIAAWVRGGLSPQSAITRMVPE